MKEYINLGEFNQIRNLLRSWQDCTEKTIKTGGVEYIISGWCSPYDSHTILKVDSCLLEKGVWLSNRQGSMYFSPVPVNIKPSDKPGLAKPREDLLPTVWLYTTLENGGGAFLPPVKNYFGKLVYIYWADQFDGFDEDGNLKPFLPGRLAYELDTTTSPFSVTITVEEEVKNGR